MAYQRKDYNESDDEKISKINSAGLINSTLESLWKDSYRAMTKGDYKLWNTLLDSIWAILGGDEKEMGKVDNRIQKLNLKIYGLGSLKSKIGKGFGEKINPNNPFQYQLLLKKALFLRRLQNKQGKGTAYSDEDEDDFD